MEIYDDRSKTTNKTCPESVMHDRSRDMSQEPLAVLSHLVTSVDDMDHMHSLKKKKKKKKKNPFNVLHLSRHSGQAVLACCWGQH